MIRGAETEAAGHLNCRWLFFFLLCDRSDKRPGAGLGFLFWILTIRFLNRFLCSIHEDHTWESASGQRREIGAVAGPHFVCV